MNSTLRLALRNPKEPIGDFPTEMLKIAAQGSAPANAAPAGRCNLRFPLHRRHGRTPARMASRNRRRSYRFGPDGFALSQRIFIVTGAKGGVGATTIAIKLVARLPAPAERMIVDADLTGKRSLAVWYDLSDDLDRARSIGTATVARAPDGTLVMELARTYEMASRKLRRPLRAR